MSLITVIGRGHSGTRVISHTLYASGVYMGSQLNPSGDKIPPQAMYDACNVMAKYIKWKGGLSWDFAPLFTMPIDSEFKRHINTYLADVLDKKVTHKGWKIPETTLVYPWITRMFPEIKFIHWIRDPRDCIIRKHMTDNLRKFGVKYPHTDDVYEMRAISWLYQYQLMEVTPKPKHVIRIYFEDFVVKQEETLKRLEAFLGIPLSRVIVRPEEVARWKTEIVPSTLPYELLRKALIENGYT